MHAAERIFPASEDALNDVLSFVEEELEKADCPMKTAMQVTVSVEEIFVNLAQYAYPEGTGEMKLTVAAGNGAVSLTFEDGGIPFNPLAQEDPDLTLSAEERPIGGLGIYMVKKSMDSVFYERKNGLNRFSMTKTFGQKV